ncbi:hypothetical protein AB8Q38_01570 [Klebsiella quasipneumoniae]|uniref:hypothetical protein n=1 Tax=Klebsiella quasipneumoniae TaxID=1463165 RepID=UPI00226DAF3E|nr:hypothetical protein [Klebsiella quasipneumoniae]MCX9886334.1 hypothetical protein [Klebsiella quasipneumoniae]HBR1263135.1 hypothetical protein [Klebsiella quasipneumoniae subsp. quasipneumoniae]
MNMMPPAGWMKCPVDSSRESSFCPGTNERLPVTMDCFPLRGDPVREIAAVGPGIDSHQILPRIFNDAVPCSRYFFAGLPILNQLVIIPRNLYGYIFKQQLNKATLSLQADKKWQMTSRKNISKYC